MASSSGRMHRWKARRLLEQQRTYFLPGVDILSALAYDEADEPSSLPLMAR